MALRPNANGMAIKATTDYGPESPLQEVELRIDPLTFLTEVSEARSLLKDRYILGYPLPLNIAQHLAKIMNPEFGYGSGLTANQFVLPNQKTKEKYGNRDRYVHNGPSEISRHNILDRLGELALLGFPLTMVHFESSRLRHEGSLQGLTRALEQGVFMKI